VHTSIEFAKSDAHQFLAGLPSFPFWESDAGPVSWTATDGAVWLTYMSYLVLAGWWALVCTRRPASHELPRWTTNAAGATLLLLYMMVILRHPVIARVPDLAAIFSIGAGAVGWEVSRRLRAWTVRGVRRPRSLPRPMRLASAFAVVAATLPLVARSAQRPPEFPRPRPRAARCRIELAVAALLATGASARRRALSRLLHHAGGPRAGDVVGA
jgi:hypothetical protein